MATVYETDMTAASMAALNAAEKKDDKEDPMAGEAVCTLCGQILQPQLTKIWTADEVRALRLSGLMTEQDIADIKLASSQGRVV